LNVGDSLIFSAKARNNVKGLILLSQKLGIYEVKKHPSFIYNEGELVEFFCPICHENLNCVKNDKLARVLMIDEKGNEFKVVFSRIAGEKSTYTITGDNVEMYGEHSGHYIDLLHMIQSM
jgi:hypothetical protein